MASAPEVSVAMATCEGGRFIDEQLQSIARQSRPPDQLVVCDDASTDDTCERVETFASEAPFAVRLERNPTRLGTTANFGRAVAACTGDVVFFADQDDVWLTGKIERMLGVLDGDDTIGAVLCNGRVVDEARNPQGYDLWTAVGFDPTEQQLARAGRAIEVFLRHVVAAGTTLAFRRRYAPLLLPFPDLRSAHDAWVAFMISAVSRFALLDEELIEYRLHDSNQFGLERLGLLAQYRQARLQVEDDAFSYAHAFFGQARERLLAQPDSAEQPSAEALALLDQKIDHAARRERMSPRLLERIRPILGETLSGGYRRFSYGWKSVAQDIFLR